LLKDKWPYIRLEAVDILKGVYPSEVVSALRELEHDKESWVRDAARERLKSLGADE